MDLFKLRIVVNVGATPRPTRRSPVHPYPDPKKASRGEKQIGTFHRPMGDEKREDGFSKKSGNKNSSNNSNNNNNFASRCAAIIKVEIVNE